MEQHPRNLWAPWRMDYLKDLVSTAAHAAPDTPSAASDATPGPTAGKRCFLCDAADTGGDADKLRQRLVLLHDARGVLLLNRYPYTNGHLLAAPAAHAPDLVDLAPAARAGLVELLALGEELLRAAINPQGFNLGANLGRCAGAGVPGHLHFHVVPRWHGDVNFMDAVGGVRVIPQALEASYAHLRETLAAMRGTGSGDVS